MIAESLFNLIKQGREEDHHGFSMGLPKLESVIDGVTQRTYTVLMSDSGSGKTNLALYSYVYQPLKEHLYDGNFKATIYSLEMASEMVYIKLLSMYIFDKYGIEISMRELLSRKRGYILSDQLFHIVEECMPWLQQVEQVVTVTDSGLSPDRLYSHLMGELEKMGHFEEGEYRKTYIPNNPNLIHVVLIDHMGLIRQSNGQTKKEAMDLVSNYLVSIRNRCGISPVVIMQTNRNVKSMERRKEGLLVGRLDDAKNSGNMIEDAEVVLSLFNPFREQIATHRGYDVKTLGPNLRTVSVLKSRYGEADIEIGLAFYGQIGYFAELPLPDQITDYLEYKNPQWILNKEIKEDKKIESKFTFTL